MARRNDIDWDLVETEYRVAHLSIRQVAEKHGIEASTITRRAKKHGWSRDLSDAVRAATKAKVRNAVANAAQQTATECARTVSVEIDRAASVGAEVIMRRQGRFNRLSNLFDSMATELESVNAEPETLQEIAKAIEEEAPQASESIKRLKTLTTRLNNLKTATEINEKLSKGEDSAYGLSESGSGGESVDALLKSIAEEEGL